MTDTGFVTASTYYSGTWTSNFTAIGASDNNRALARGTTFLSGTASQHSFGIPSNAIIDGIEVVAEFSASGSLYTATVRMSLSSNGGTTYTATKSDTVSGSTDATKTYGGATDLWGQAWIPSSFDSANFFQKIEGKSDNAVIDCRLDYTAVKVYYHLAGGGFFLLMR